MPIAIPKALVLLCLSATAAGADGSGLSCIGPTDAAATTERLCAALQDAVRSRNGVVLNRVQGDTPGLLRLEVVEAGPIGLAARLAWVTPAGDAAGPVLELSVIDRDTIPEKALSRFAHSLLSITAPDLPAPLSDP